MLSLSKHDVLKTFSAKSKQALSVKEARGSSHGLLLCNSGPGGISARGGSIRPLATMFYSRRVRRRLGFYDALPSGWFAVWFCSLIAFCYVLFPLPPKSPDIGIQWPTQFGASCDGGMLPLFLPPLHPDSTRQMRWDFPYKTAAELDAFRQWRDIDFTGAPITDFMAFASTIQAVKTMQAATSYKVGLRIHFRPHATFSSLVTTLDRLYILRQEKTSYQEHYWLDLRQEPVIRYFIAVKIAYQPVQPLFL